jgi:outer membrane biosynthesis protein TonB
VNNLFDLIDKYKYGIVTAFAAAVGMFVYLQLSSVTEQFEIDGFLPTSSVEITKDELLITPENTEFSQELAAGKVSNTARDMNDTRTRSEENWSASKSMGDVEKSVKEEERRMFEETGGEAKRKAIKESDEERKRNHKEPSAIEPKAKGEGNAQTGPNAFKGNVMVDWSLSNRRPYQNNEWWVQNPGYTCGYGASGKVCVQIKVGQDGKVISAIQDVAASSGFTSCMVEQALKYAKKSRFDYSSAAVSVQTGKIIYTFVSQ